MTQFVDSIGLLLGSVIALGVVFSVGRLIGGSRAPWLGPGLVAVVAFCGPLGLAAAFDRYGVAARAVVVRRTESIRRTWNGGFERRFALDVKYPGGGPGESFPIRLDQQHYDQVAFGDPVTVAALPIRRRFARLAGMTSRQWLAVVMPWDALVTIGAIAACLVALLLYGGSGAVGSIRKVVALVLFMGGGWTCYRDSRPYSGPEPPGASVLPGEARVRAIDPVDRIGSTTRSRGWTLASPYDLIELEFTPSGLRAPVVAVDAIDRGSIPYLARDQALAITYSTDDPRSARLKAGGRRFATDNAGMFRTYSIMSLIAVVGIGLLAWLARRRRA